MNGHSNNDWASIVSAMRHDAGLSNRVMSEALGRAPTYVNSAVHNYKHGGSPNADLLAAMAAACGYELHLTGHGRDFLIRP